MEDLRWRAGFKETNCLSCPHSLQPQHDVMGLREHRGTGWTAVTRSIKGHWPCQIGPSQNPGGQAFALSPVLPRTLLGPILLLPSP